MSSPRLLFARSIQFVSIRRVVTLVFLLTFVAYIFPNFHKSPLQSQSSSKSRSRPSLFSLPSIVTLRRPKVKARPVCQRPPRASTIFIDSRNQSWESPSLAMPLDSTLAERMESWRQSPLASLSHWTTFNRRTCGNERVGKQEDVGHTKMSRPTWETLSEDLVKSIREKLLRVLDSATADGLLDRNGEAVDRGSGRGLIFTAGNADTFSRTITSLRLLRSFRTTLPAEVFHFSSEIPTADELEALTSLGAVLRAVDIDKELGEVAGLAEDKKRSKNFHIKGEAFRKSSFEELLYLDSDSIPAGDVTPLFDSPGYLRLGALFWPDYWKDTGENPIWSILGIQCRDEWTMEAGQVLINRAKHLDALLLVEHMESYFSFFFTFSAGDKDLFRYAFLALRKRWAVPGKFMNAVGFPNYIGDHGIEVKPFCGHTMLQYDPYGQPLFIHANLIKQFPDKFGIDSTWGMTAAIDFDQIYSFFNFSIASNTSSNTPFTDGNLSADDLANVDYQTGFGIESMRYPSSTSPYTLGEQRGIMQRNRVRALLENGFLTGYRDDRHLGKYLCIITDWDILLERVKGPRERPIHLELPSSYWTNIIAAVVPESEVIEAEGPDEICRIDRLQGIDWQGLEEFQPMKLLSWGDKKMLKDFPQAFYKIGKGKANREPV